MAQIRIKHTTLKAMNRALWEWRNEINYIYRDTISAKKNLCFSMIRNTKEPKRKL